MYKDELNKLKNRVSKLENLLRKFAVWSGFHIENELDFSQDEPTRDSGNGKNFPKCIRKPKKISQKSTDGITVAKVKKQSGKYADEDNNSLFPDAYEENSNAELIFKMECSADSDSQFDIAKFVKIDEVQRTQDENDNDPHFPEAEAESDPGRNELQALYEPLIIPQQSSSCQAFNPFVGLLPLNLSKLPQKKQTGEKYPLKCPHCLYRGKENWHFRRHLKTHSTKTRKACYFCSKSFKSSRNYENHLRHHTTERHYPCPHCRKSFSTPSVYKNHVGKSHPDCFPYLPRYKFQTTDKLRRYKCTECSYSCNHPCDIRRHMNSVHCKITPTCYFCTLAFKNIPSYMKHLSRHTGERPQNVKKRHNCPDCSYKSDKTDHMKRHMKCKHGKMLRNRTENVMKRHNCPDCPYKTDKTDHMKRHLKSKHGKMFVRLPPEVDTFSRRLGPPLKCPLCPHHNPIAGAPETYISPHVQIHHPEAFGGVQCPHCPFKSRRRRVDKLVKHIANIHPNDYSLQMQFDCSLCDYKCRNEADFRSHMTNRHSNNEEFILCHLCPYKTLNKRHFNEHVRKRHNKKKSEDV